MKRILYIHHTFREQSYNSLFYEFAQRVNKKKFKIYASCLRESGPYENKLKAIGVNVKNFQMRTVFDFSVIFKLHVPYYIFVVYHCKTICSCMILKLKWVELILQSII